MPGSSWNLPSLNHDFFWKNSERMLTIPVVEATFSTSDVFDDVSKELGNSTIDSFIFHLERKLLQFKEEITQKEENTSVRK